MSTSRVADYVTVIDSPYHGRRGVLGTYLVRGEKPALIDPGPATQATGVLEALGSLGVGEIETVALTHVHLDHAAGSWMLLDAYPHASVHCHPRGAQHMADPSRIVAAAREVFGDGVSLYGEVRGLPQGRIRDSQDGESLDLGGVELRVLWTPGHSTHSQSYYEPDGRVLFAGDAAGHTPGNLGVWVPASPPPFNPAQALESLDRLLALRPETLCISHFGFHGDAEGLLRSFRGQVALWARLASRAVEEGLDLRGLYGLVEAEDPSVGRMAADPELRGSLYQSLVGFHSYARWERERRPA